MTNEEAIKMLKSKMDGHTDTSYEWAETVRMAIKALESQPCEDCISRKEAINELKTAYFNKDLQGAKDDPCIVDAMTDWAIRTIKRLPSVTQKTDVLNKIKAEIIELRSKQNVGVLECLDIIDKYRAESEIKNE